MRCLWLTAALLLVPATAAAQQTWSATYTPGVPTRPSSIDNVGNQGQIVIGAERITGLFHDRLTLSDDAGVDEETTFKFTTVGLFGMNAQTPSSMPRLALDYFLIDGVNIGGSFAYVPADINQSTEIDGDTVIDDADVSSESMLLLNVRAGYAYPFDETFGIWARGGLAWSRMAQEAFNEDGDTISDATLSMFGLTVDLMLVISPFEHFVFLAGPYLDLGFAGSSEDPENDVDEDARLTSVGLSVGIAGYFGD